MPRSGTGGDNGGLLLVPLRERERPDQRRRQLLRLPRRLHLPAARDADRRPGHGPHRRVLHPQGERVRSDRLLHVRRTESATRRRIRQLRCLRTGSSSRAAADVQRAREQLSPRAEHAKRARNPRRGGRRRPPRRTRVRGSRAERAPRRARARHRGPQGGARRRRRGADARPAIVHERARKHRCEEAGVARPRSRAALANEARDAARNRARADRRGGCDVRGERGTHVEYIEAAFTA